MTLWILALIFGNPPAYADDDPILNHMEVTVQLVPNLLDLGAEIGRFGVGSDGKFFGGIMKQKGIINPILELYDEESLLGTTLNEETGEPDSYLLRSTLALTSSSYLLWKESSGEKRSGSDVGVGIYFNVSDPNDPFDPFIGANFYLAVRTNSLLGGTEYPNHVKDGLTGATELNVGASFLTGETAYIRIEYDQIKSWIGASSNRVFEQTFTAKLTDPGNPMGVDFYGQVHTWKIQGDGNTEFRVGIQFNDLFSKIASTFGQPDQEDAKSGWTKKLSGQKYDQQNVPEKKKKQ